MKKMMLAKIGIPFQTKDDIPFERSIKLHECTQILSVSVKQDKDKYILWINYMYPTRVQSKSSYQEFHFIIASCCYTEIKINNHNYIGSFDIEDKTYAVLYKAGEIIKN